MEIRVTKRPIHRVEIPRWDKRAGRQRRALAVGLLGLFALVYLGPPPPASAVVFTGPAPLELPAGVRSCHAMRFADDTFDHLLVGQDDGALSLLRYFVNSNSFQIRERFLLEGRLVAVAPWEGRPLLDPGVVVATADPDAVLFLDASPMEPYFAVVDRVELEEDPGSLAFVGDVAGGQGQIAVSLPGIDQVLFLAQTEGWSVVATIPVGDDPRSLTAVDLDGDQMRELVVAQRGYLSGDLGVFREDGQGGWALTVVSLAGVAPEAVTAQDLDGDGTQELAVLDRYLPRVTIYSDQAGELVAVGAAELSLPANDLALTTLEDDTPVLVTASADRGLVEYRQLLGGTWVDLGTYYPGCQPVQSKTVDADGDGQPDLVSAGGDSRRLTLLLGTDDPGFAGFPALTLNAIPGSFGWGDFDGNGGTDVLVASADAQQLSLFAAAPGQSPSPSAIAIDLSFFPGGMCVFQADEDPAAELAVLDVGQSQVVIMGYTPGNGFAEIARLDVTGLPRWVDSADVDADGFADLIVLTFGGNEAHVLYGAGGGAFPQTVSLSYSNTVAQIVALDLNGDDDLDLVATDGAFRVWTRLNGGGRSFSDTTWLNAGTGAYYIAAGDLDGDLDDDVVVANRTEQSLTFFENVGAGSLVRRIGGHALTGSPSGMALGDFDGDQRLDVLVNVADESHLSLVVSVRNWEYFVPQDVAGSPDMSTFGVVDFNLDGAPDILVLDQGLRLGVALLNGETGQVAVEAPQLAYECQDGGLTIVMRPDRSGPWLLETNVGGSWRFLATPGQTTAGSLERDGQAWILTLTRADIAAVGQPEQLRLTVGTDADREYQIWELAAPCSPGGAVAQPPLSWARAPWPNPFNPTVSARFRLTRAAVVRAVVHDVAGRQVAVLWEGRLSAGDHALTWDGRGERAAAAAGLYLLRIETADAVLTSKLALIK